MSLASFEQQIRTITDRIAGRPLDGALEQLLNEEFPADGDVFQQINQACHQAIQEGWMCQHERGGIRFGRVIKPNEALGGFSVDVVHMQNIAGPHHRHPNGEIDMIMPITPSAKFDGRGQGWLVYPPDSAHPPTVTDGEALVLYLLPDGAIEFTRP
ncbi:MAG: DUF4863 family protein [Ectothiorhodospiraceae bacterium]|nr:DUF4863 family protein [Ectothiorhodospiraceae bacterium]